MMVDAMRSHASGRELAALGHADGRSAMPVASVTVRLREAQARVSPAQPGSAGPERPRRARSCIRAREIMGSTI
jgi:hypothetical protein